MMQLQTYLIKMSIEVVFPLSWGCSLGKESLYSYRIAAPKPISPNVLLDVYGIVWIFSY